MADGFGKQLRELRQACRLMQAQVAKLVGRSSNTVARWERGERTPDVLVQEAVLARLRELPPIQRRAGR